MVGQTKRDIKYTIMIMNRKSLTVNNLILTLLACCIQTSLAAQGIVTQPNVIFFATDDLRNWVNPLGYEQAKTPNLERLANMGITFTNAHAPGAYCAPSRTAIFTGLHASTTGCYNDELYFFDYPELVGLHQAFSQAGYKAYGAGKLFHHSGGSIDMRGWEEYFARTQEMKEGGYNTGYHGSDVPLPDPYPYSPYYTKTGRQITGGAFLEWGPIPNELEDSMPAGLRTNWVCDLLMQEHNEPFFIGLGLYIPHYPNYAPQKYFDMYNREDIQLPEVLEGDWLDLPAHMKNRMTNRNKIRQELIALDAYKDAVLGYLAAVSFADAMLGRVLDTLEASAYKDNTVVIFWSDQGYHLGEKGQWGKHTLWQETTNVPLIIAGAGLPGDQTVNTTVSLIDLYPTLIDLCGLTKPHEMDGISLMPILTNPGSAQDRNVLMPFHERGGYTVINQNYRYMRYNDGSEEFYDLKTDPLEWNNLAGDNSYRSMMDAMAASAPGTFAVEATPRNSLKLVLDGDTFYWEKKDKSEPAPLIRTSITFSDPRIEQGIHLAESLESLEEAYTEYTELEGKGCRSIAAGKHAALMLDDPVFGQGDGHLMVDIAYKGGTGNFGMEYISTLGTFRTVAIEKEAQPGWPVASFMIADADFSGNAAEDIDIRLTGEACIRSVVIRKHVPSDVSLTFSDPIISNGMQFLINTTDPAKETYTEAALVDGVECRYIPITDKRKYGYFKVDDHRILTEDRELTFELTYYDAGATLMLQYNSENENYEKVDIVPTNTQKWITRIIPVRDAAFANAQNNQSDFRIHNDVHIRRVAVHKGIDSFQVLPLDSVEVENLVVTSGVLPSVMKHVNVYFSGNTINIDVAGAWVGSDVFVYNVLGEVLHHEKIGRTYHTLSIHPRPGVYIVSILKDNYRVNKKILVGSGSLVVDVAPAMVDPDMVVRPSIPVKSISKVSI
jgi:arylsulfatase A-like enzyme